MLQTADYVLCDDPRSWWPARGRSTGYACPARTGYWVLDGEWGLQGRFRQGTAQHDANIQPLEFFVAT